MPYVPFEVPPGVARGATSRSLPGRWFDSNLVRWDSGVLTSVGGWYRQTEDPLDSIPRTLCSWADASDSRFTGIGCDGHVYLMQSDTVTDITPSGFTPADPNTAFGGYGTYLYSAQDYGDVRETPQPAGLVRGTTLSMDSFGNLLLFTASWDGLLYQWDPSVGGAAVEVTGTGVPVSLRGVVVTPDRFVIAIGGNGTPRRVLWSDQEDHTDWTITTTNKAGYLDLDTSGYLITLKLVREGTLIFGDNDIFLLRFVGAPFYFTQAPIAQNTSLMSPNAIATFNGKAMWMTHQGFQLYDGGYVKDVPCELGDFLFKDIDPFWGRVRTWAMFNGQFNEVWFFYPSSGSQECDSYVFWNFQDGYWSKGKMARTCGQPPVFDQFPIMGSPDMHIWRHEDGDAFTSAGVGDIFVESGAIHPKPGGLVSVMSMMPDSGLGAQTSEFTFYARNTPEGIETTHGPYVPRSDGYMDTRLTCRQYRVRARQRQAGNWSIGSPEIDIRPRGGR